MPQLRDNKCQRVFLVGAKSIGAYGGFETFVDKLTEYHQNNKKIKFHIARKANGEGYMDERNLRGVTRYSDSDFLYHNAHCFKIFTPNIGPAAGIYYDIIIREFLKSHTQFGYYNDSQQAFYRRIRPQISLWI